jgi:ubiquinone/menaquinone biosynthesis C-methylase UbiE
MTFSIESVAKEYIYRRYPKASIPEKEKIVKNWEKKMTDAQSLVNDFKKRVGEVRGKKIIDLGSGNGCISIAFALAGADVYGVEVEEELVAMANEYATAYNVKPQFALYGDGATLPYSEGFFDYAISTSVLEHTTYPVIYLQEAYRVLKFGGFMYLGFPNKIWPKETHTGLWFLTYVPGFFRPIVVKFFGKNPLTENNLHFYTYFEMKKMLRESGVWRLIEERGESKNIIKVIIKNILGYIGLSYKVFLPHILVVLKKDEK